MQNDNRCGICKMTILVEYTKCHKWTTKNYWYHIGRYHRLSNHTSFWTLDDKWICIDVPLVFRNVDVCLYIYLYLFDTLLFNYTLLNKPWSLYNSFLNWILFATLFFLHFLFLFLQIINQTLININKVFFSHYHTSRAYL